MVEDGIWFDGPNDELGDDEFPDEDEFDDDSSLTVECPECGAEIYEDAVQCPVCGTYVTHRAGHVWSGRPTWWIAVGVLGILATILALAGLVSW
jgi:zinc ribbon protein